MHDSELDNPGSNGDPKAGTEAPDSERTEIMSRLPRSRPQRRNYSRPAESEPSHTAPATTEATEPRPEERSRSGGGQPAGIPELTVSGAYEIAKLPLKVGAHAAFRALDAVARSLRSR